MSRLDSAFEAALGRRDAECRRRVLRVVAPAGPGRLEHAGRALLDVSANDYLGLSRHPALRQRSDAWAERWGTGAGASRLVRGSFEAHARVEAKVAALKGREAALVFASGWQANASVLAALLRLPASGASVFADELVHASLHHGVRAAGLRPRLFAHNDLAHLEVLLAAEPATTQRFILTESVFSMDGDRADLPALAAIAGRHDAFLYVDEAHATGVLGPAGAGLAAAVPGIDLVMGTFSKALGAFGAYVAGSRLLIDWLINACSGFIYTTALPPNVLGAVDAALDLLPDLDADRAQLASQATRLRAALAGLGIVTAGSTQIVPALVGEAGRALALAAALERRGVLAVAIRPPTVPPGTSRLRLALSAAHTAADLGHLVDAIAAAWRECPA